MLEAFSYFFFNFQTFACPSDFLNDKRDFPLKISLEIIACNVEAVRQPTGAFPPTEVNKKTKKLINKFLEGSLTRNLNKIRHDNRQTVVA